MISNQFEIVNCVRTIRILVDCLKCSEFVFDSEIEQKKTLNEHYWEKFEKIGRIGKYNNKIDKIPNFGKKIGKTQKRKCFWFELGLIDKKNSFLLNISSFTIDFKILMKFR